MSHLFRTSSRARGFTLMELLVVITIIAILSAVVLSSLNSSRQRARDTKRITDIQQLRLALALYFDGNGNYPKGLSDLAPNYISVVPTPPAGTIQTVYTYVPLSIPPSAAMCNGYHLGAVLENAGNSVLTNDSNESGGTVGTGCTGSATLPAGDFPGRSPDCASNFLGELCYDITP